MEEAAQVTICSCVLIQKKSLSLRQEIENWVKKPNFKTKKLLTNITVKIYIQFSTF